MSVLTGSLQPWLELDWSRGNQIAGRLLNWQQEKLETLGQALDLLLERKNRVWARVFVKLLSSCVGINSKLSNWARQLDNAGQRSHIYVKIMDDLMCLSGVWMEV